MAIPFAIGGVQSVVRDGVRCRVEKGIVMRLESLECRGCVGVGGDDSVAEGTLVVGGEVVCIS